MSICIRMWRNYIMRHDLALFDTSQEAARSITVSNTPRRKPRRALAPAKAENIYQNDQDDG